VAALIINSFFVGRFAKLASERPYASLARHERLPLLISGAVSTLSWLGAIACGLLLG
jgi:hypothetical protein